MRQDIVNNIKITPSISPITIPAAQTGLVTKGTAVDVAGYESVALEVALGAIVAGDAAATTGAVVLEESDTTTDGDFGTIAAGDLIAVDTLTGLVAANAGQTKKIGYIGSKRYVRAKATITTGATTGAFPISCAIILGNARNNPVV